MEAANWADASAARRFQVRELDTKTRKLRDAWRASHPPRRRALTGRERAACACAALLLAWGAAYLGLVLDESVLGFTQLEPSVIYYPREALGGLLVASGLVLLFFTLLPRNRIWRTALILLLVLSLALNAALTWKSYEMGAYIITRSQDQLAGIPDESVIVARLRHLTRVGWIFTLPSLALLVSAVGWWWWLR